jgi:hypothetical protein
MEVMDPMELAVPLAITLSQLVEQEQMEEVSQVLVLEDLVEREM